MSKVILMPCDSYEEIQVYTAIKDGFTRLGGVSRFVNPEDKILLKLNLLGKAKAEAAVTTHPSVFKAVVQILREHDCEHITYGDSPATTQPDKVAASCGITEAAAQLNLQMADFVHGTETTLEHPIICDKFNICNAVLEADGMLNLCKMKTHALERVTGAVKNSYGCVCGLTKGFIHTQYPNAISFADLLTDLNHLVKPKLHIMDGILAMEGNGPASGTPTPMNVILMSTDPVALDAVFCSLIDLDPSLVPTNVSGQKGGIGTYESSEIEVETPGGSYTLEEISKLYGNPKFDVCRGVEGTVSSTLSQVLNPFRKRPVIDKNKCIKCGACVKACPVPEKAISQKNKEVFPKYNYKKCIRCYCCQEICPAGAIEVKEPFLAKIFKSK